ncbi:hypothetical protein CSKR_200680, partial [Clonorchis sinensis]
MRLAMVVTMVVPASVEIGRAVVSDKMGLNVGPVLAWRNPPSPVTWAYRFLDLGPFLPSVIFH